MKIDDMRVAVASCWKYRDCWRPFFLLFEKFWPEMDPECVDLISDEFDDALDWPMKNVYVSENKPWAKMLAEYAGDFDYYEAIMLLQDDMFLNAPVNQPLIEHALDVLDYDDVGAVRLYPCPGANAPSPDFYFGPVTRGTAYRNSLQATIYRPDYLRAIASRYNTPQEFEIEGSKWASESRSELVLAFKRELPQPWPISYECTAVVSGKWTRSALELCASHGIEVDTSMREVA